MSEIFVPKKARRQKMKAIAGFMGPSGSGKTLGALLTAYGLVKEMFPELPPEELWEKVGIVDTEHDRSQLYSNVRVGGIQVLEFMHVGLTPPYTTQRYNGAVKALKEAGCEVVIIDSLTHWWDGEGGILDEHNKVTQNSRSKNSFNSWNEMKPLIKDFISLLTTNNIHILTTVRVKQEYVQEQEEVQGRLKTVIRKVGLKPVLKDDLEYEFLAMFSVDESHLAHATKDNALGLFESMDNFAVTPELGKIMYDWLEQGIDVKAQMEDEKKRIAERTQFLLTEFQKEMDANEKAKAYFAQLEVKYNRTLDKFPLDTLEQLYAKMNKPKEENKVSEEQSKQEETEAPNKTAEIISLSQEAPELKALMDDYLKKMKLDVVDLDEKQTDLLHQMLQIRKKKLAQGA